MNIEITTFSNPFSFFCRVEDDYKELHIMQEIDKVHFIKNEMLNVQHGQYVAVMWKNKWVRGIITLETNFSIWLIDYGIYIRPDESTVYIEQPADCKKAPTKIFEASVHGVIPLDKVLTQDCEIKNEPSFMWNTAAQERAKDLIRSAIQIYFVPIAFLSNKINDIVLGDLYLKISEKKIVNIVDELVLWPVFLEKNEEIYIKNLNKYYITRRRHRACMLKPDFPDYDLPTMTLETTLAEYNAFCEEAPQFDLTLDLASSDEGGTVVVREARKHNNKDGFRLSPSEIEEYSRMYWTVHGRRYNVLRVLLNKMRDLAMCERYQHRKSVGRACSRRKPAAPAFDIDLDLDNSDLDV